MRKYIAIALLLLMPVIVLADGSDTADNVVYGTNAGLNLETDGTGSRGTGNAYFGVNAGRADSTGSANTGLGYGALNRLANGIGNITIGYLAGDSLTTSTSHLLRIHTGFYPDYGIFGILSSGYIGINKPTPTVALDVVGGINLTSKLAGDLYEIIATDGNVAFTPAQSGALRRAYSIASKRTDTLPDAAAGLYYDFTVEDADSLVITCTATDSIQDGKSVIETAVIYTSTVSGACRLIAVDGTYWVLINKQGTWTEYNID